MAREVQEAEEDMPDSRKQVSREKMEDMLQKVGMPADQAVLAATVDDSETAPILFGF
jgi:hypothetical protein